MNYSQLHPLLCRLPVADARNICPPQIFFYEAGRLPLQPCFIFIRPGCGWSNLLWNPNWGQLFQSTRSDPSHLTHSHECQNMGLGNLRLFLRVTLCMNWKWIAAAEITPCRETMMAPKVKWKMFSCLKKLIFMLCRFSVYVCPYFAFLIWDFRLNCSAIKAVPRPDAITFHIVSKGNHSILKHSLLTALRILIKVSMPAPIHLSISRLQPRWII